LCASSYQHTNDKGAIDRLPEDLGTPATNLARLPLSINPPIRCKGFAMSSAHSTAAVARPAARLTLSQKNALVAAKPCSISNASREIPFFLLPAQLGLALRFNQLAVIFTFDLSVIIRHL
jgi:hypothetical protein